jgi:chorismate dehydratase
MLGGSDAALLIGDPGMRAEAGDGVFVLDLGKAWEDLTGRPFVWAAWIGFEGLDDGLSSLLREAKEAGKGNLEAIAHRESEVSGWPLALCRRYLIEVMNYELDAEHWEALRLFGELCVQHAILPRFEMPAVVGALPTG